MNIRLRAGWMIVLLLVSGCASRPAGNDSAFATELTRRPTLLLEPGVDPRSLALRGIGIGDDEAEVRKQPIDEETPAGWLVFRDGNRVRVVGGTVVSLGLWNTSQLASLGLKTRGDVERAFGRPESEDRLRISMNEITILRYPARRLDVQWNESESRLLGINLHAATSN